MLSDEQIEKITGASRARASMWLIASAIARAIEAEVRKDDEALIGQLADALDECAEDSASVVNDYVQAYGENHRPLRLKAMRETVTKAKDALAAARARLAKAP